MTAMHLLLVAIGGFFGAIARFRVSRKLNGKSPVLPIGTLTVNLLGSFLLGLITGSAADSKIALLFGTGFMGAFTTFSTLKLEMVQMNENRRRKQLALYLLVTYGGGILLAYAGYLLGKVIF